MNETMRFSLTTLFAVVSAVAAVCGVTVWAMKQSPQDVLHSAHIGRNEYIDGIRTMRISGKSNLHWPALKASQTLTPSCVQLIVTDRQWTPELARWIEAHPTFTSLCFENCQGFDDQFAATLEQCDGLWRLELRKCDLSQFTFPDNLELRTLVLDDAIVTDEQLQPVATYQHLTQFSADGTWLSDEGLRAVRHLPLHRVSLMDTSVSQQLVEQLLEIDGIQFIYLSERQTPPHPRRTPKSLVISRSIDLPPRPAGRDRRATGGNGKGGRRRLPNAATTSLRPGPLPPPRTTSFPPTLPVRVRLGGLARKIVATGTTRKQKRPWPTAPSTTG